MPDEPETEVDWQKRFPKMTPLQGVPSLATINGCGFSLYGGRDYDEITGTYVKTHVFVILFIPIIAFKSFRVADAEGGGWYFISREPLSGFASGWNKLLFMAIFALIGGGVWNAHNNSPAKVAERKLAAAQAIEAEGKIYEAAVAYKGLMNGPQKVAAKAGMMNIADNLLVTQPVGEQVRLLDLLVRNESNRIYRLDRNYLELGMGLAASAKASDLKTAYDLLVAVRGQGAEDPGFLALYEEVLAARVVEGDDMDLLMEYALLLESRDGAGDPEKLIAILDARRDSLGSSEGARILGQHEAEAGNIDAALELLLPYTEAGLVAYHEAEKALQEETDRAGQRALRELRSGRAGEPWYRRYEAANEEVQGTMVDEWITKHMDGNGGLQQHRQAFIETVSVVPHAMDLGILLLQRAQTLADAEARTSELERSEEMFMAIQGAAGDNPQYQLFLGQVKYWLGKSDEGEALFQQFLANAEGDDADHSKMAVANTYREVGESAKARAIYEDVYNTSDEQELKDGAAHMRAITQVDAEDALIWLKRVKNSSPAVRATTLSSEGDVAAGEGDLETAIAKYKESLEVYASMGEEVSVLNNSALILGDLFAVSGDSEYYRQAVERLRKANSLAPDDSITMGNFASLLLGSAVVAVTESHIDFATLRESLDASSLTKLSTDRESRLALQKALVDHPAFAESATFNAKARVLAPKSLRSYNNLSQIYIQRDDAAALRQLRDDLLAAEVDREAMDAEILDVYAGNQDDTILQDRRSSVANLQARIAALGETTPQTSAYLHIQLSESVHHLWSHDTSVDPELAIAAASTAVSTYSSQNARLTLASAYFLSCADSLVDSHPAFAEFVQSTRNSLNTEYRLAAVLKSGPEELWQAIIGNQRFQDGLAIYKEETLDDDWFYSTWLWAMTRQVDAEFANTIAEHYKSVEAKQYSREIAHAMNPMSAYNLLASAWLLEIRGDSDGAKAMLETGREAGIPLPSQ